ncbi:MAG TPA: cytochrome c oxidase assembly protein [Candidatus Binataceae bacterium]|nr:cytochrome c oxidase assembly protein [Candidatus Binataceae bacterium]
MAEILTAWDPDISVLTGCTALLVGYWVAHRGDYRRAGWFCTGVAVILLALISPLDILGDDYLFCAHMGQHLLLELVAPPLLLLGISPRFASVIVAGPLGRLERVLGNPLVSWPLGMGMLALWHIPALYDAALNNEGIHIIEHLSFMTTATIFWWPVLARLPEHRITPLSVQLYLLAGAMANSLLGIWLTFFPRALYAPYLHSHDILHIDALLRVQWRLQPMLDQQIGGLLMWVGGGFVFLTAMVVSFLQWFSDNPAMIEH